MNKKHGFVTTAWMLGGGLLLNANLVQAQVSAPAEEYYAPQQGVSASTTTVPGLLPNTIRDADALKNRTIVRPISPTDTLNAGRKINGAVATPKSSPNRVKITPANFQNSGTTQPANQSVAAPSPIQQQLEEMYRKDGRPMPQMNFNQTPISANGQLQNANPNTVAHPNAVPPNAVPAKPRSLISKLNPFSRTKGAPAPLPNHPASPMPNTTAGAPQLRQGVSPGANAINQAGANNLNGFNNGAPLPLPAPPATTQVPQAAQSAAQGGSQLPDALPPVPGDPGYLAPAVKAAEAAASRTLPVAVEDTLENVFNDSEDEKPVTPPSQSTAPKPIENENPFSGLSLDEEFGPATNPPDAKSKSETTTGTGEIPPLSDALPAEPTIDEIEAKMKLITERGELRGLKGFCPIALRDARELKNALPEHHSTFKGRTYYFSSADAKSLFDEKPQHYAPISGGQDVVLLKEKVTKEGSLDHAIWFKDRLYLFTSQKTLEQFVAAPKEFAISE